VHRVDQRSESLVLAARGRTEGKGVIERVGF